MERECPRCGGNQSRQPVPSRTNNKTLICAECGTDEKLEALRKDLTPKNSWPVARRERALR